MEQEWEVDLQCAMSVALRGIEKHCFCSTKVISVHRHLARLDGLKFHAYEFEFEVDFTPEVVNDRFGGFEVFGMGPFGFQVIADGDRVSSAGHVRGAFIFYCNRNTLA